MSKWYIIMLVLLTSCDHIETLNNQANILKIADGVYRIEDKENNIICYEYSAYGISCIKNK